MSYNIDNRAYRSRRGYLPELEHERHWFLEPAKSPMNLPDADFVMQESFEMAAEPILMRLGDGMPSAGFLACHFVMVVP